MMFVHYCTVKKCDCQKFYSLTIARKQQQQQPAPVYDDIVGQSQNIERFIEQVGSIYMNMAN